MATKDLGSQPKFDWTEEEKHLLLRTLRVRVLEQDRLEVETTTGSLLERGLLLLLWIGFSVITAAAGASVTTTVVAGNVQVTPAAFLALAFVTLPMMSGFVYLAKDPPCPLSFFPGTGWIVSHRPGQNALGRIDALDRARPTWNSPIHVTTTIGDFLLRTRVAVSLSRRTRVQALLLGRCTPTVADEEPPPSSVVELVGREVLGIPSAFYAPLVRYTRLVSVTPESLVIRNGTGPFLAWVMWLVEFAIGMTIAMVNMFGILPNLFTIGGIANRICEPLFAVALFLMALIHSMFAYADKRRHLLQTVALNKQASYLVYSDHLGEAQIPTSECTMSLEANPREKDDDEPGPDAIEIRHGKKRLAKWTLKNPLPSDQVARTLDQGIREYLRSGQHRKQAQRRMDR
jgi:hypothetical protein